MVGRRLPRAERAAQTRDEVLAAAGRVFAAKGYAGASIADIAEEAGYTHGAVYAHFTGKQQLFLALFERRTAESVQLIEAFFDAAPGTFADRVRVLADETVKQSQADPAGFLLSAEFAIVAARDPELRAEFAERIGAIAASLVTLIEREQREGRIDPDVSARELGVGLHALSVGLGLNHAINPGSVRPELLGELSERLLATVTLPPA